MSLSLPHFAHQGQLYNGFPVSGLDASGAERLGIHNAARSGVVTRGVLIDMAWHKDVDYLEPGTAITVQDLEEWERRTGVRVSSGDVLLIRTGRWEAVRQLGLWDFVERAAGSHASVAKWLKARDVAIIGSDGRSTSCQPVARGRPTRVSSPSLTTVPAGSTRGCRLPAKS